MRSRSRSRLSTWLLVAALLLTALSTNGSAIDTGQRPPTNHCTYCISFFGWIICITTTAPIDGDADPGACMY